MTSNVTLSDTLSDSCVSQVAADTNISTIATQVESLSSSSGVSANTDTQAADPE